MSAQKTLTILGAGCASLSLARHKTRLPFDDIHIITDQDPCDRADHIWGFWQMPWLDEASDLSRKSWQKWKIITKEHSILHEAHHHPYHAISARSWLQSCQEIADPRVTITTIHEDLPDAPYFDSRPLPRPKDAMRQHFIGHHITTKTPAFDPSTALLMDFRCDQSEGLHFLYLLPFSETEALVESTLFSYNLLDDAYYETAIKRYLEDCHNLTDYDVISVEKGDIPMADIYDRASPDTAIGARGGAIRPSSGYAFTFIQKQIADLLASYQPTNTNQGKATRPISKRDLWMDAVFLRVLKGRPDLSISLFAKMAKVLTGDEFACFMSGTANAMILFKVILAMPKFVFLSAAIQHSISQPMRDKRQKT